MGVGSNGSLTHFFNHPFVLIVAADPYPYKIVVIFNSEGSVIKTYPDRPELADLLEMERRVTGISFW